MIINLKDNETEANILKTSETLQVSPFELMAIHESDAVTIDLMGHYSIKETCEILGIQRQTLRAWTVAGKIRCLFRKVNGRPIYQGADIVRCLVGKYSA